MEYMNLYELSGAYKEIQELIEDGKEGLEDTLEALEGALEDKAIGYAKVMKNLEAQASAIKEEEKRLRERRKSIENNIKRMKESLQGAMEYNNIKRIKTDLFTFNIQKNVPSLKVNENALIPAEYFEKQDPKLNRKALTDAIKNGLTIDGVELIQSEGLRIR